MDREGGGDGCKNTPSKVRSAENIALSIYSFAKAVCRGGSTRFPQHTYKLYMSGAAAETSMPPRWPDDALHTQPGRHAAVKHPFPPDGTRNASRMVTHALAAACRAGSVPCTDWDLCAFNSRVLTIAPCLALKSTGRTSQALLRALESCV